MQVDLYSEEEIVKGCQQHERKYQEVLYRLYARKMYGICMSYAGNREFAQDMLHDAFLKIFRTIETYKSDGTLEAWIRRVVTNTAIDQLRNKQRLDNYITEEMDGTVQVKNPTVLSELATKELLNLVSHLPDGARAIFNLFAIEGYTHREIATQLQISESTSKSQYNRAKKLLQNLIINIQRNETDIH